MAYTKIHPIKNTVGKSIDYICDENKTDESLLISSFGCTRETAAYDFRFLQNQNNRDDTIKAYHLIQSFAPGEVSPDTAHKIGNELADKLLGGEYPYVVTTHIDKGHVHNHIIFCSVNSISYKKFNNTKSTYYSIRRTSDSLCKEYGLSVIEPSKSKGKSYKEWQTHNEKTSWKDLLKSDIASAKYEAKSYIEFMSLMKEKGYSIKGETFGENSLKYISFKAPGASRFIRGSIRSLGKEYTKESLKEYFDNKEKARNNPKIRTAPIIRNKIIDTDTDKMQSSPGLKRWADAENLKIASKSYASAGSIVELENKLSAVQTEIKELRATTITTDKQIKMLSELIHYKKQYDSFKQIHSRYLSSKDPERYLRRHEADLMLFDAANRKLKEMGVNPDRLSLSKMEQDLFAMKDRKNTLTDKAKKLKTKEKELSKHYDNLKGYLKEGLVADSTYKSIVKPATPQL